MKKIISFLLTLFLFLIFVVKGEATITTSPATMSIPRGIQTTKNITYNITNILGCPQATSTIGQFISGTNILGVVSTTISANLTGAVITSGTVTETLNIPVRVIRKAEELGINRFQYRRQFTFSGVGCSPIPPQNGVAQITLTSEAAAEFRITRLQLYFENQRAEITIKRNQPSLKAFVDIRFVGSGLLQGYWEVDGRVLSHVNRYVVYGRSITLESPEIPALPTFIAGTHLVRFVITNPTQTVSLPEAIYFVTTEEYKEKRFIQLVYPQNNSELDYSPLTFRWEGRDRNVINLVEFLEVVGEKPVFSAYTKRLEYSLPMPVLKDIFSQGKSYLWRVKGFDTENNIVGESIIFRFTFKPLSSYLPGHILLARKTLRKVMN